MTSPASRIVDDSRVKHWKRMAIVGLVVTVVAMGVCVLTALAGNPKAEALAAKAGGDQARETEQLKQAFREREKEIDALKKELSKGDDLSKIEGHIRHIEELKREKERLSETLAGLDRRKEEILARIREPGAFGLTSPGTPAPAPAPAAAAPRLSVPEVAKSTLPAVAIVKTDRRSGTAFFIYTSGELLTNYHVIEQSASIEVTYLAGDQRKTAPARPVAIDPQNDLAVLKVDGLSGMPVLVVKEGALPAVGTAVLVMGFPSLGKEALEFTLADGVVSNILVSQRGGTLLQTTAPINEGSDGGPALDSEGTLLGIATAKAEGVQGIGFVISTRSIARFFANRSAYAIPGTLKEWEVSQRRALPIFHDPTKGITLDGSPTRLFLTEGGDRIAALDSTANGVTVVSLSQRKVLATVYTGTDPSWMSPAPNGKGVWVSHEKAGDLVRVDLDKAAEAERIVYPDYKSVRSVGASSNYLWILPGDHSTFAIYSFSSKAWVKTPFAKVGTTIFAVDGRRGRLVLLGTDGALYEVDPERLASASTSFSKLKAAPPPQTVEAEFAKLFRGQKTRVNRGYSREYTPLFADEKNGRLYFEDRVYKSDNLEEPLAVFPATRMSDTKEATWSAQINAGPSGRVWAASPDGRWAATGTHLFDVARRLPPVELPMPTTAMCFSKDSKTLWFFDFVNKVLMPFAIPE